MIQLFSIPLGGPAVFFVFGVGVAIAIELLLIHVHLVIGDADRCEVLNSNKRRPRYQRQLTHSCRPHSDRGIFRPRTKAKNDSERQGRARVRKE